MVSVEQLTNEIEILFAKFATQLGYISQPSTKNRIVKIHTFFRDTNSSPIIQTSPASGKTTLATNLVNEVFHKYGLPSLYFVLAHDVVEAVPGRGTWNHWRGHNRFDCTDYKDASARRDKHYPVRVDCDCEYEQQFSTDRPTIAPFEYIFGVDLVRLWGGLLPENIPPIRREIEEFKLRVVDEIDFNRLVNKITVTFNELTVVSRSHDQNVIRSLCDLFLTLMDRLSVSGDKTWSGMQLYDQLSAIVDKEANSLERLVRKLDTLKVSETHVNLPKASVPTTMPENFPPYLIPIVIGEIRRYLKRKEFNPRIHLTKTDSGPELRIRWLRWVIHLMPTIILDASADPVLLDKAFGRVPLQGISLKSESPQLPDNVRVYQWSHDQVGRSTLGLYPYNNPAKRTKWYKLLDSHLRDYPRDSEVGLVTFDAIEKEAKAEIINMGFTNVKSLHYWGLRSENTLKDVEILILFGCPIPNPDEVKEEAQAFFYNEEPLRTESSKVVQHLLKKDGNRIPVDVRVYTQDERLQAYFKQKCQWELYQALHRCRPFRADPNKEKTIFVYTNMPIPEFMIDDILVDEHRQQMSDRLEHAVSLICQPINIRVWTVPELAKKITIQGEDWRSVAAWIRDNYAELETMANVIYVAGKARRPGRFERTG